jgi:hypothetical protein
MCRRKVLFLPLIVKRAKPRSHGLALALASLKGVAMTSTVKASVIGGAAGCATMFFLDPARGARRRALVRDKAVRIAHKTRDAADATRRDAGNRLHGLRARADAKFSDDVVDDVRLQARVRAALGRVASHPRAITVVATHGWVRLTGDTLASELPAILSAAEAVRGVAGVQNELRTHASADGNPALQGSSARPASWTGWMRRSWSPTALLAAGVTTGAAALALAALSRRETTEAGGDGFAVVDVIAIEPLH